jgi:hypothetical protein
MPKSIKATSSRKIPPTQKPPEPELNEEVGPAMKPPRSMTRWVVLVAFLILLAGLLYKNKNLFLVGMVGKTPVFRWQLDQALEKKYGKQEFDNITTELLIQKEAVSKKITAPQKEIDEEIAKIEKNLTGQISLDDALKAQGMTREDLKNQVRIRLFLDKLLENETKVEEKEIDDFIAKNKDNITSSDTAQVRAQVKETLHQQKISQQFESWLNGVKQRITVLNFL